LKNVKMSRKFLALLAAMGLSAFALTARPSAAIRCECAPLDGEYCGANGVTYDSPCVAACFHVQIVHAGHC
jgi:hypothetical protein